MTEVRVLYVRYFLIAVAIILGLLVGAWLFDACEAEDAEDGEVGAVVTLVR